MIVACLLETDPQTGISMYLAITNDGAKRAAFDAVCKIKLSETDILKLQDILRRVGDRYKDRNNAVHGHWGLSKSYPNKLLWGDMRTSVIFHVDMMALKGPEKNDERFHRMMAYQKTIMVYDERDLIRIQNQLLAAYDELKTYMAPLLTRAYGTSTLYIPTPPKGPPRMRGRKPRPSGK